MKGKTGLIVSIAVFALSIGAAALLYNNLSGNAPPSIEREEAQSGGEESEANKKVEKIKAPDFTVEDMEGNPVKLSDMAGTPVVLNFWASWCPPCKAEMPEFQKVWEEVGTDVAFMMVDLVDGQTETREKGTQYVSSQGFSFPVYFDMEQEAAYNYGISSIPTTLFIDSEGYIVTGARGMINEEALRNGIELIYEK